MLVGAALCWEPLACPLRLRARQLPEQPRPSVVSSTLLLQAFREVAGLARNASSGAAASPPLNGSARADLEAFHRAQLQSAPRGSLLDWLPLHGREAFCAGCWRRPRAQASLALGALHLFAASCGGAASLAAAGQGACARRAELKPS